jgi:hypothetical protein
MHQKLALYMILVVTFSRDCFEDLHLKITGGINVASILLDIIWLSFYSVKCSDNYQRKGVVVREQLFGPPMEQLKCWHSSDGNHLLLH